MYDRIREIAPDGVDAVFDHVGGAALHDSWRLLRRGGALVNYGSAATKDERQRDAAGAEAVRAAACCGTCCPTAERAGFYNFWAGKRFGPAAFRARLRDDLTQVLRLVRDGVLTPQIAARIPLPEAAAALALAESRTVLGKVVIVPEP